MSDEANKMREHRLNNLINQMASSFDPVREIQAIYPNHIISAREFNRKHMTDRRAYGEFVSLEALENIQSVIHHFSTRFARPRAKNWGDILILYIIDKDPIKLVKAQSHLEKVSFRHPRIVIALPKKTVRVADILLRLAAVTRLHSQETNLGDKASWEEMMRRLRTALKTQLHWDKWLWFYKGGYIETEGDITQSEIISFLLDDLYPGIVNPGHKALSRMHGLSTPDRKRVRSMVNKILAIRQPMVTIGNEKDHVYEVFRALADLGLLRCIAREGPEETWDLNDIIPDASPIKAIWESMNSYILEQIREGKEIPFNTITEKYLGEPYSLTPAMLKIMFSLLWRNHYQYLAFFTNSGGRVKRAENLTFQRLTDILRNPEPWHISLRRIRHDEIPYLRTILQIFSREKAIAVPPSSLWSESLRIVYNWFKEKPRFLRKKKFSNQHVHDFLSALERNRDANGPELFLHHIPASLGFDLKKLDLKYDSSLIVESLEFTVKEINEVHREALDEIADQVQKAIEDALPRVPDMSSEEDDNICIHLQRWLKESGIKENLDILTDRERALYQLILTTGNDEERFLERLPVTLGMKPTVKWQEDRTSELVTRLKTSLYRVAHADHLVLVNGTDQTLKRRMIIKLLLDVFQREHLSPEETEEVLENYLKELTGAVEHS